MQGLFWQKDKRTVKKEQDESSTAANRHAPKYKGQAEKENMPGKRRKADMTWKKKGFSYLIWFVYTLFTGTALLSLGIGFSVEAGIAAWWGIPAVALYLGIVAGVVFFLYRTSIRRRAFVEKNCTLLLVAESALMVILLAVGLALRVYRIGEAEGDSVYFAMAEVVAGQQVPQMVHGAVYFYVQLLHGVMLLLGNRLLAGVGLQIALQLLACTGLYFVVRRLAGRGAALVSFGFCMLGSYMRGNVLTLSPDMLYFLLFVLVALLIIGSLAGKLRFPVYFAMGLLSAFCFYVDIIGGLLFLLCIAIVFGEGDKTVTVGKRVAASGICGLGFGAGFLIFIGADSFISGKSFVRVAEAWFELYRVESFRMPIMVGTADPGIEGLLLMGLMAFGIFAFWCDRRRDHIFPYVVSTCIVMVGCLYGVLTEEMPGFTTLYLLFAILAGISLEQSFQAVSVSEEEAALEKGMDLWSKKSGIEMSIERIRQQEEKLAEAGEQAFYEDREVEQVQTLDKLMEKASEETLSREESKDEFQPEDDYGGTEAPSETEEKQIKYLDNPLPLPKKHVKRVLDYAVQVSVEDDFDYPLREGDDFDI